MKRERKKPVRKPVTLPVAGGWWTAAQVLLKYSLTRPPLRRMIREGRFPAPIEVSHNVYRWTPKQISDYDALKLRELEQRLALAGMPVEPPPKRGRGRPRRQPMAQAA